MGGGGGQSVNRWNEGVNRFFSKRVEGVGGPKTMKGVKRGGGGNQGRIEVF